MGDTTHVAKGIKPQWAPGVGCVVERWRTSPFLKGSPGKVAVGRLWGSGGWHWGQKGTGLGITEGEISGNQNWGELPQDPVSARVWVYQACCHLAGSRRLT